MKNKEIEIQVNIENPEALLGFLEEKAGFISEENQTDDYFYPSHRNFAEARPIKEWLRIRESENNCSVNYKNWHFDKEGKSYYADEYETKVRDTEALRKIFQVLNFKPLVRVAKKRRVWKYKNYKILLDSVEELGNFVEIEYIGKGNNLNPRETTEKMVAFLKKIGCGKIRRNYVGYPFQLLFPEEVKYEEL